MARSWRRLFGPRCGSRPALTRRRFPLSCSQKGCRIRVGPDLSVPGHPDIFAIGDTALSLAWDGQPVPGLAPAAKQGGAYVASVLRVRLRGRKPPQPFRYRHQGSLATIGRRSAVADFGRVKVTGAAAWWLWGAVHVRTPAMTRPATSSEAGVGKAPRHEIAGGVGTVGAVGSMGI
jgi:NADH dehydrogenase FAD-containing subunit